MKLSRKLKSAWRRFIADYDTSDYDTFKLFGLGGNPSAFFFGVWLENKNKRGTRR